VTRSGELLATTHHVCVLVPVHPGFGGTPPRRLAGSPALAELHNGLIELLGLQDVTVTGNSIGGWTTAEIALPRSPRGSTASQQLARKTSSTHKLRIAKGRWVPWTFPVRRSSRCSAEQDWQMSLPQLGRHSLTRWIPRP
jgi:hypothetical protein